MKLTRYGFQFLVLLERLGKGKYTQKWLANKLSFSVGVVNKFINQFLEEEYIATDEKGCLFLSQKGKELLEPYRVKRAIILAAGFSERLAPVTLNVPKPLVNIKGIMLVEPLLNALLAAEIEDITVVVGYKAEMFQTLKEKYPFINIVNNPLYNQSQNITSLLSAKDKIDSCYICDADIYIHNPSIISKYEFESCFFGVPVRATNDWCFSLAGKKVRNLRIGGEDCYRAVFITYLNDADSKKLCRDIEALSKSLGGLEHRWFDVLFGEKEDKYRLEVKSCYAEDTSEVDNIADLVTLDNSYLNFSL